MTANVIDEYRLNQRRKQRDAAQNAEALALAKAQARAAFWHGLSRGIARSFMEAVTHVPVGVAVVLSCVGASQFGLLGYVFMAMSVALSVLLSRTYAMWCNAQARDVRWFLPVLGFFAFAWECYFVHLGFSVANKVNAAQGLMTFEEVVMIGGSVALGTFNLFSRRSFITGHENAASDAAAPETYYRSRKKADRLFAGLSNAAEKDQRVAQMADGVAVETFLRHGAWPYGYKPTERALAEVEQRA